MLIVRVRGANLHLMRVRDNIWNARLSTPDDAIVSLTDMFLVHRTVQSA